MNEKWRKFWTIVLGVVFVLAFAAFVLGLVIRRDLLSPELYTTTLAEADLLGYLDQVSEGRLGPIPQRLIRASTKGLSQLEGERMVNAMLGPASGTATEETRLQMEAALAADDMPGAIALAVTERLQIRVTNALVAAEPRLADSEALVGISGAAAQLGQTRDQVVGTLNTVRDYAELLQNLMIPLVILMLTCIVLIIWLNADDLRSALSAAGWTLTAASGVVMALWLIGGLVLRSVIRTKLTAAVIGPASLDGIIDDIVRTFGRGIWSSVWTTAVWWLIIGLVLLAFANSKELMAFLKRLLEPVWEYRWAVLAAVLGIFVLLPLLYRVATADARAANLPCNGYVELCDRPLNEVAYASSHNAMSIAEYGWIWPMHDGTLTDQLNDGVRALLIDTHYLDTESRKADFLAQLPPEMAAVARKAIAHFEPPALEGEFFCHQLCALGFSSALEGLNEVRAFLEQNPREVLFIVIQDEITASDTDLVINQVGLSPYIYTHPEGQSWPTLRELIDSNQRLIIMAENEGPPPDWYTNVWNSTEETPYTFIFKEDFSCEPNRGGTDKPFFLLNHWIQRGAPNRVDAAIVNDYDFLLARARQCETERGKMPNFIAVNWYSQGDLINVVDTLNGVGQPPAPTTP